jgi:serine/threonine protein kinase
MQDYKGRILKGRFEIVKCLAGGGFGETFKAKDLHDLGHPICVVKKFRPTVITEAALDFALDKFYQEAEMLRKLGQHPQIPNLIAYFSDENDLYLAQEYVEGHTLDQEIQPNQVLAEEAVIDILTQGLEILGFIHEQGVIHRDIKPQNIMRRQKDGKLVLIDFGAVKEVISHQDLKASTFIIGTPGYIAPEQMSRKPDFRSDIYALGILCIEALKGVRFDPFAPIHSNSKIYRNGKGEIVWQHDVNVSKGLAAILKKMVRSNVEERYSAKTALEDVKKLTLDTSRTQHLGRDNSDPPALNGGITKRIWIISSAIGAIAIIGIVLTFISNFTDRMQLNLDGRVLSDQFESTDILAQLPLVFGAASSSKIYARRYTFWGQKNQKIVIDMSSDQLDPRLVLLTPSGTELQANDDISPSDRNARITAELPIDGKYVVQAESPQGELGRYQLRAAKQE